MDEKNIECIYCGLLKSTTDSVKVRCFLARDGVHKFSPEEEPVDSVADLKETIVNILEKVYKWGSNNGDSRVSTTQKDEMSISLALETILALFYMEKEKTRKECSKDLLKSKLS